MRSRGEVARPIRSDIRLEGLRRGEWELPLRGSFHVPRHGTRIGVAAAGTSGKGGPDDYPCSGRCLAEGERARGALARRADTRTCAVWGFDFRSLPEYGRVRG